jgi:hypothetical protein
MDVNAWSELDTAALLAYCLALQFQRSLHSVAVSIKALGRKNDHKRTEKIGGSQPLAQVHGAVVDH